MKPLGAFSACVLSFACAFTGFAQGGGANSGTVRGTVVDPSGAAIPKATVTLQNPISHFIANATTDSEGAFQIPNIPFNNYHATATASGFSGEA
jgi:Carboxypeptidase regulatory-like domain